MKLHRAPGAWPDFNKAVVTIGTFDGVHRGHRQIITQLKEEAARIGGETVIISFHPHPRKIVPSSKEEIRLLNTPEEKAALLQETGIDHLVIVPFDAAFAAQTAEEYIGHFLYGHFRPHTVIIGYDHRFGKERKGDYHLMETYGHRLGFEVKEIPEEVLNNVVISSTRIRKALTENDIHTANGFLGYPYFFEGKVVEGNRLGRTLGYPTANIQVDNADKLIPGDGVYAVTANKRETDTEYSLNRGRQEIPGMMNIGMRPTVGGTKRLIEVNLFDFDEDIYGSVLQVHMHHFIRGERKFSGLDALKEQLGKDRTAAMQLLR